MGAVFIGASTSLPGTVMSIVAAANDHPGLAISNTLGGIAAQTTFLVIADMLYRHANLEHAAASQQNLVQGSLLLILLSLPLLGIAGPVVTFASIHPLSFVILLFYGYGIRLIAHSQRVPMWLPRRTRHTRKEPRRRRRPPTARLAVQWLAFGGLVIALSMSGWVLAHAAIALAKQTGLSETTIGTMFTAITTSLPELVVVLAAVRSGALTLAVGDIIGGNLYDVLVLPMADVAYRNGSIYDAFEPAHVLWLGLNLLLTAILLTGLLRRERHGIANIGTESVMVLVCYLLGVAALNWI